MITRGKPWNWDLNPGSVCFPLAGCGGCATLISLALGLTW